jgi:hypothetical protein
MKTDLTVIMPDRPGTLAEMGEALGKAGVNIEGCCGFAVGNEGVIHILVEDAKAARRALQATGFKVSAERPVLVTNIADKPGELGKLARRLANAGVNIDLGYTIGKGELVLGVDDLEKGRLAL